VNVAALPDPLVESELFGVARGAFTGAIADRAGLVEAAGGGSLFLDEAGDLPLAIQPKLLRVLDHGEVRRVGATNTTPVHFRLLVAAQEEPAELRQTGRWRADLYYRLASVILRVPALRERRTDIPDLVVACLVTHGLPGITPAALELLQEYDWPGNVRELQQALIRSAFYADGGPIGADHVRKALTSGSHVTSADGQHTLAAVRSRHVMSVVAACSGNTQEAAELLGVSRRHVYRLLRGAAGLDRRKARDVAATGCDAYPRDRNVTEIDISVQERERGTGAILRNFQRRNHLTR